MFAQLSYYFNIPKPEELTDEELTLKWAQLQWVREDEAKRNLKH